MGEICCASRTSDCKVKFMKNKKTLFLLTTFLFGLIAIMSCSSEVSTTTVLPTIETIIMPPISLPNPSPDTTGLGYTPTTFPTSTYFPTLSVSQSADLIQFLKSDICNLPCYLGIEPGKTTFQEAGNIITEIGGRLRAGYENYYEGYPEKSPLHLDTYILISHDTDKPVYQDIYITEKDGKVQQFLVDVFSNSQPLFYEAWANYSIESIFNKYGKPDQILIYPGERYDVRVLYLNHGMIIDWLGMQNDNYFEHKLCSKFSKENIISLVVVVADTKSAFEIIPSSYMGFEEMWKSTNETLGVSEKEFYDKVVQDSTACFDVKTDP